MLADLFNGHRQQFIDLCKSHEEKLGIQLENNILLTRDGPSTCSRTIRWRRLRWKR